MLLLALGRTLPNHTSFVLGLVLMSSPPFLEVGRSPTPDALSAMLVLGGLYAFVHADRPLAGTLLLLLSIVARPNNVILCVVLAFWWWLTAPSRSMRPLLGAALATVVSLGTTWATGGYSWGVYFTHTFVRRVTDLASVRSEVTISNYLSALGPALQGANVLYPSFLLLFLAISLIGLAATRHEDGPAERWKASCLVAAVWAAFGMQFLVHPMLADRLYLVHYALVVLVTVSLLELRHRDGSFAPVSSRA